LDEARAAAQEAAQDHADAETALGELEGELDILRRRRDGAQVEIDGLRDTVQEIAVDRYTVGEPSILLERDLNEYPIAQALLRYVTRHDIEVLDRYRSARDDLEEANDSLRERLAQQEDALDDLEAARARLDRELEVLEAAEEARLAEEARRRVAAERRAAEDARREAAARAAAATTTTDGSDELAAAPTPAPDASGPGPTAPVPVPPGPTPPPPTPPPSPGTIVCPVPGSVFVDSWGAPRAGGRRHEGVDMMASSGRPVYAPATGSVSHRSNTIGGLSFNLDADDGRYYYGTHLSGYGQGGRVQAGTVIGYVGDTGNAAGNPHLHFEIHINGSPVNPYPYVRAAC
jgi:murein DD-endopeptidase MepM/ murein hydrolase activator NlpD